MLLPVFRAGGRVHFCVEGLTELAGPALRLGAVRLPKETRKFFHALAFGSRIRVTLFIQRVLFAGIWSEILGGYDCCCKRVPPSVGPSISNNCKPTKNLVRKKTISPSPGARVQCCECRCKNSLLVTAHSDLITAWIIWIPARTFRFGAR